MIVHLSHNVVITLGCRVCSEGVFVLEARYRVVRYSSEIRHSNLEGKK